MEDDAFPPPPLNNSVFTKGGKTRGVVDVGDADDVGEVFLPVASGIGGRLGAVPEIKPPEAESPAGNAPGFRAGIDAGSLRAMEDEEEVEEAERASATGAH